MELDWMFVCYPTSWREQMEILTQWLEADPVALAIPNREAEEFVAVAYMLRFMGGQDALNLYRAAGARMLHQNERNRRRAVLTVLRKWKEPIWRERLTWLTANSGFGPRYPDVATHRELWTEKRFDQAYEASTNIMWLVRIKRYLGEDGDLSAWLEQLAPRAQRDYEGWLTAGKLTLSRLVYAEAGGATVVAEAAASSQVVRTEELREKDRKSVALRYNVRRLEQDRKHLKEQARRAELEAKAVLTQARGEVAAARRTLQEQLAAQELARSHRVQEYERQVAALREQLAVARRDLRRTLDSWAATPRAGVFGGRAFGLTGKPAEVEAGRLLIASLGGQVVPAGGALLLDASRGLVELERQLRRLALQQVLIKCDGNHRRRRHRPGICMSAFQFYVGGEAGMDERRVTCCGPAASAQVSEYGAVVMALRWLVAEGLGAGAQVEIWSDCKYMVQQVHGKRPLENRRGCAMLHGEVQRLLRMLGARGCHVTLRWVPREQVHAVDRLCARGYYEQQWYHRPQGRLSRPLKSFLSEVRGRKEA